MTLAAVAVHPGTARGPAHRCRTAPYVPTQGSVAVVAAQDWETIDPGGSAPAAYVFDRAPTASGRIPEVPSVAGLEPEIFRDGEVVEVDGTVGSVRIEGVEDVGVVTSFLVTVDGRVLLLRRSDRVGSFQGRWAAVSGFLEDPTPLEQALREIREETGFRAEEVELLARGELLRARDRARIYVVHPFLFQVRREEVRLDWEHTESAWVAPAEIERRETVPELDRAWAAVAAGLRRKG